MYILDHSLPLCLNAISLQSESSRSRNRFFLLLGLTILSAFGSRRAVIGGASLAGAGALGVLVTAFVASQGWESLQLVRNAVFSINTLCCKCKRVSYRGGHPEMSMGSHPLEF